MIHNALWIAAAFHNMLLQLRSDVKEHGGRRGVMADDTTYACVVLSKIASPDRCLLSLAHVYN